MDKGQHLQAYAGGWVGGDAEAILGAVADSFVFHDPAGAVAKANFAAYFTKLKDDVGKAGGNQPGTPFLEISEVVTNEAEGVLTAWCWWRYSGTDVGGSGLIKVGDQGVTSEHITHFTPHPGL